MVKGTERKNKHNNEVLGKTQDNIAYNESITTSGSVVNVNNYESTNFIFTL